MKKLMILAIALMVVVVAVPAFASVQNVKVSGGVESTYIYRRNFDFSRGGGDDLDQSVFITQTTLRVDADLTDQVSATIGLINERPWEANPGTTDSGSDLTEVDLYLAYVTLREMLYSPLTLVVGRQDFRYGNSFIMDSAGSNNTAPNESGINSVAEDLTKQTSLDAIRAILDYNPLKLEIVYAQIHPGTTTFADLQDKAYLVGVNATYEFGDEYGSLAEAYLWKRTDKTDSNNGTTGEKADVIKVVGIRGSTNPIEGLNVQGEFAYQSGNNFDSSSGPIGMNRSRAAYAMQGIVNYQVPVLEEYKPVAQYVFTKVTGNDDAGNVEGEWNGWDPFFENQSSGKIYNTLFNLTNADIHELSLQAEPMEDVTAKLSLTSLWLQRKVDPLTGIDLVQPDGITGGAVIKDVNSWIGKEVDFDLTYDYTEDVQIGASLGYFFPGSLFTPQNDTVAKQVLVNLDVAF